MSTAEPVNQMLSACYSLNPCVAKSVADQMGGEDTFNDNERETRE